MWCHGAWLWGGCSDPGLEERNFQCLYTLTFSSSGCKAHLFLQGCSNMSHTKCSLCPHGQDALTAHISSSKCSIWAQWGTGCSSSYAPLQRWGPTDLPSPSQIWLPGCCLSWGALHSQSSQKWGKLRPFLTVLEELTLEKAGPSYHQCLK